MKKNKFIHHVLRRSKYLLISFLCLIKYFKLYNYFTKPNFSCKKFSQHNEDGLIEALINLLKINIKAVRFVEIGIQDGLECNTANLLIKGASGKWIDADQISIKKAKYNYKKYIDKKNLKIINKKVNEKNINHFFDDEIDFLSIDIDGLDYYLIKALKFSPKIICVEYNGNIHWSKSFIQDKNKNIFFKKFPLSWGASIKSINELMIKKGYVFIFSDISNTNAFFVRSDLNIYKNLKNLSLKSSYPHRPFLNHHVINDIEKLKIIHNV